MSSIRAARDRGYAVEIDVRSTADGHVIVFHDSDSKRMTGVEKLISATPWADLQRLRLKNTGEHIPSLEEVLDEVSGQAPLFIEIKSRALTHHLVKKVILSLAGYQGPVAVMSFNPVVLYWFRRLAGHVVRGQLATLSQEDEIPWCLRPLIHKMSFGFITRPHFMAHDIEDIHLPAIQKMRNQLPLLSWTIRNQQQHQKATAFSDNLIFETWSGGPLQ